jgi:hypothetical protein
VVRVKPGDNDERAPTRRDRLYRQQKQKTDSKDMRAEPRAHGIADKNRMGHFANVSELYNASLKFNQCSRLTIWTAAHYPEMRAGFFATLQDLKMRARQPVQNAFASRQCYNRSSP